MSTRSEGSPGRAEAKFGVIQDIAHISPVSLADYHLAVAAVGRGVLPIALEKRAEQSIEAFHDDLIVALGDAMAKEMLPWKGGQTVTTDPIRPTEQMKRFATNPVMRAKYVREADELEWTTSVAAKDSGSKFIGWLGVEQVRLMFGMRQVLAETTKPVEQRGIVRDISMLTGMITRAIDAASNDGRSRNTGWKPIQESTADFIDLTARCDATDPKTMMAANILLGLLHNSGQSVLQKFSLDDKKVSAMLQVLDASRTSDKAVAELASPFGRRVYDYLSGQKTTLFGVIPLK
jgi:hypothetical protein